MKKMLWMVMAWAMTAVSGCSLDQSELPQPDVEKKITFNTSIETQSIVSNVSQQGLTRAPQLSENGSGNFVNGDIFTLLISTSSGHATNCDYQIGSSALYWKDIPCDPEDRSVDFAACYPTQALVDGKFTFDLKASEDKDLLWARMSGVPPMTETPINLTFKHVMHRLVINYEMAPEERPDDPIQTVCTAQSTCEFDLASGTLDTSASRKADFTAVGDMAAFLLVPQRVSDVSLRIAFGQNVKELRLDELVTGYDSLEGGLQLNVNLKITNGAIILDGASIIEWGDQGVVEGEIIM